MYLVKKHTGNNERHLSVRVLWSLMHDCALSPNPGRGERVKTLISKMHYRTLYDDVFNVSQSKSHTVAGGGRG